MSVQPSSSIIRWAGSKRQLLPKLVSLAPKEYVNYFEPFAGSACLFFALRPGRATLGDINAELLNAWQTVREDHQTLYTRLAALPVSEEIYKQLRAERPQDLSLMQRAVRFLYLNRLCYNAVYRTNRAGQFNVPMGTKTGGFPSRAAFAEAAERLSVAMLHTGDFESCLTEATVDDFAYLDPPYSSSRRYSGEYGYGAFSSSDEDRLIETLLDLDRRRVKVLLSYTASACLKRLPSNWTTYDVQVRRHVSGFSKGRGAAPEVIVANYLRH